MENIHTLIIPDIHGRDFWKTPVTQVLETTGAEICFLGDFHDPYPQEEWTKGKDYLQESVDNFRQILETKKQNPERITLLIGNHDCGYAISSDICSSRMDRKHKSELRTLFRENWELFRLAKRCDIAGKTFILSHAGIHKEWVKRVWGKIADNPGFDVVRELNEAWAEADHGILGSLGIYDRYRGWGGAHYGSPVWADIQSWVGISPAESFGFHVVGHTQLRKNPIVLDTIADVDCRTAFYIDTEGKLRSYESGEELKKSEI